MKRKMTRLARGEKWGVRVEGDGVAARATLGAWLDKSKSAASDPKPNALLRSICRREMWAIADWIKLLPIISLYTVL